MNLFARRGGVSFLLKPAGYVRDKQGIFKMGRGLGWIFAGYFNYWGPNLPIAQTQPILQYVLYISNNSSCPYIVDNYLFRSSHTVARFTVFV
jgi:hypothetical protein